MLSKLERMFKIVRNKIVISITKNIKQVVLLKSIDNDWIRNRNYCSFCGSIVLNVYMNQYLKSFGEKICKKTENIFATP